MGRIRVLENRTDQREGLSASLSGLGHDVVVSESLGPAECLVTSPPPVAVLIGSVSGSGHLGNASATGWPRPPHEDRGHRPHEIPTARASSRASPCPLSGIQPFEASTSATASLSHLRLRRHPRASTTAASAARPRPAGDDRITATRLGRGAGRASREGPPEKIRPLEAFNDPCRTGSLSR